MATRQKRSWAAIIWLVACLVFFGMFAVNYWIQGDAMPLYSFAHGFLSGVCALLAWGSRRRAQRK